MGTNEYANVRRGDTDDPRNVSSDYENIDDDPPSTVLRKRFQCTRRIIAYTVAGTTIAVLCGLAIASVFFIRHDFEVLSTHDNIDLKCYELWDDAINVSPITTTRSTRQVAGLDVTIRRDLHALQAVLEKLSSMSNNVNATDDDDEYFKNYIGELLQSVKALLTFGPNVM
ncbi:hypothetical protein EAI_02620 [Harpegnathos saltator]|uniref:Uncharacterized protein n=1 Tax=Harpegnathos saltator TaxID=610380 RepID=E2C7V9_HARSA|nr:hypothetical protein EAI_02620 [Harpegnathos saltator]